MNKKHIILNIETKETFEYTGPFQYKQETYVLDASLKVLKGIPDEYWDHDQTCRLTLHFEESLIFKSASENDMISLYKYEDIAYLYDQAISDTHKLLNRNIAWKDRRTQYSLKMLRKNIDKAREKIKNNLILTPTELKVHLLVLERYRKVTHIDKAKPLSTRAIEIHYNTTLNTEL